MRVVKKVTEIKGVIRRLKKGGKTIGFVPTMGYFHEGHLSLIRQARKDCDVVIVSIFVNPTQFGAGEDYEKYPRDLTRDVDLAQKEKIDFIFAPDVSEMYPPSYATFVELEGLSKMMCGKRRPNHFRGVTTIVMKLFNLIEPDIGYFGQKDAQQVVIIRKMVSDLNMGLEIKVLPIVREKDGLAMSSRNEYLSERERKSATVLYTALLKAKEEITRGEKKTAVIRKRLTKMIESNKLARLDYVEMVDPENLSKKISIDGPVLIAIAAWVGKTRLIDNITVNP